MARRRSTPEPSADETPTVPVTRPAPEPSRVLVQISKGGPLGVRRLGSDGEVQEARVLPGLTMLSAQEWALVSACPSWGKRSAAGELRALAGHDKGLAQDWAALPRRQVVALLDRRSAPMVAKMERSIDEPRRRVLDALRPYLG